MNSDRWKECPLPPPLEPGHSLGRRACWTQEGLRLSGDTAPPGPRGCPVGFRWWSSATPIPAPGTLGSPSPQNAISCPTPGPGPPSASCCLVREGVTVTCDLCPLCPPAHAGDAEPPRLGQWMPLRESTGGGDADCVLVSARPRQEGHPDVTAVFCCPRTLSAQAQARDTPQTRTRDPWGPQA